MTNPKALTPAQIKYCLVAATDPPSNIGQQFALGSQTDINALPSQHGTMNPQMALSSSNTAASPTTSPDSSSGGFCFSPQTVSSIGTVAPPTGKHQCHGSTDNTERRPGKLKRKRSTAKVSLIIYPTLRHLTSQPQKSKEPPIDEEQPPKKKQHADLEWICVLCMILGRDCDP